MASPSLLGFSLVAFGMALTPGPNMMYLVSRSICQGRTAGLISLAGVASAFIVYMVVSAFGITAIFLAVPLAYDVLRFTGSGYLMYMAWQALKPGGRSPFQLRELARDSPWRLYAMGFITNLLNPKAAIMYLSLLPQFIDTRQGSVLGQSITLGSVQIIISMTVNALIACAAGSIASFLNTRPSWLRLQRWVMGTVLTGLAVRMALDGRN